MTYWLGVETPEVWEEAQRNDDNRYGFPTTRRKTVEQKIQPGDRIINYMTKRQVFFAVYEVTKGYVYVPNRSFAGKAVPECVEVKKIVELLPENGIPFHQIKNDLNSFRALGNPTKWGVLVQRSATPWNNEDGERLLNALRDRAPASELESDLQAINQQKTATERKQYIDARLGQGQFRTKLLERWGNRCAVTGNAVRDAIRASHAKPWKQSTDEERLDPENGLPLLATLDALFDAGLITFDEIGRMTLSPKLTGEQAELDQLGVSNSRRLQREPTEKERCFLAYHRDFVFQK